MNKTNMSRIYFYLLFLFVIISNSFSQEPITIDHNYISVKIKLVYDTEIVMDYVIENDVMIKQLISILENAQPIVPSIGSIIQEGMYTISFVYKNREEKYYCYLNNVIQGEFENSWYYSKDEDIVNLLRDFLITYFIENGIIK